MNVIGLIFIMIVPVSCLGYGELLTRNYPLIRGRGVISCYIVGFFTLLAAFTVFSIPFTILRRPFHELRTVFALLYACGILLCILETVIWKAYRQWLIWAKQIVNIFRCYWWIVLPTGIILFQTTRSVLCTTSVYSDDTIYITRILDMVTHDRILGCDPVTGLFSDISLMSSAKFVLSSWLQFLAAVCSMAGIHPLILIKTIFPAFMIPFHYLIMWKMTFYLSEDSKKRILMILLYALLMEFGSNSVRTDYSYYLFTWSWYGKSVYQYAVIPGVILFFLMIRDHTTDWRDGLLLMVLCIAGIGTSTTALMLLPVELVLLILFECISKRSVRELWISVPSLGPVGICAILFFVLF